MIIGKKIHENIRKIDLTLYKYIQEKNLVNTSCKEN